MFPTSAELTPTELDLRQQVRAFLGEQLPTGTFEPGLGMGAAVDPAFSAALARHGWVGMAVPERYGGQGATAVDRFV
ncbi:MAG: acyl-CoA dehydrogenase family protein, partial [Mycobacterium sp.]